MIYNTPIYCCLILITLAMYCWILVHFSAKVLRNGGKVRYMPTGETNQCNLLLGVCMFQFGKTDLVGKRFQTKMLVCNPSCRTALPLDPTNYS